MLVLLLALGAIVNVAVAWGCVQRTFSGRIEQIVMHDPDELTLHGLFPANLSILDWDIVVIDREVAMDRQEERLSVHLTYGDSNLILIGFQTSAGLPLHSLLIRSGEIPKGSNWPPPPASVSLRPIWPGFAINTLFYAAILGIMFAAVGVLRRKRRARRGLCVKCAYDLRGIDSSQCPECGEVIRQSRGPRGREEAARGAQADAGNAP